MSIACRSSASFTAARWQTAAAARTRARRKELDAALEAGGIRIDCFEEFGFPDQGSVYELAAIARRIAALIEAVPYGGRRRTISQRPRTMAGCTTSTSIGAWTAARGARSRPARFALLARDERGRPAPAAA